MRNKYTFWRFVTKVKESINESANSITLKPPRWSKLLLFTAAISMMTLFMATSTTIQNVCEETCLASEENDVNKQLSVTQNKTYFVDQSVEGKQLFDQSFNQDYNVFQLFSHGKPGELYIEGEWKDAEQLAHWLARIKLPTASHINIYGCEFAKGEKGQAAVEYLEAALSVSIAASDDITGIDGDWDLEVGLAYQLIQIKDYPYNLQSCTCTEFIYLNETTGGGSVHKYSIDPNDGSMTEILTNGSFWYPGTNASEMPKPHGLASDLNGNIYIGENTGGDVRRLDCQGNIVPAANYEIDRGGFNFVSVGNTIFINPGNSTSIEAYDLCTQQFINEACLDGLAASAEIDWGLSLAPDGTLYASAGYGNNYSGAKVWKVTPSDFGSATCITPFLVADPSGADPSLGDTFLPDSELRGIVADPNGFFYVVERITARDARIHKYDSSGQWVDATPIDNVAGDGGYASAQGIVYSETSGYLYVSTISRTDDCVSIIDPVTMDYVAVGVPSPGDDSQAKGIAINKECCPVQNNMVIDTTLCNANFGDFIFLQELIDCEGTICEGIWEESPGNALTYNECNNSITPSIGCSTFTKTSDGTGNNPQCGAFSITVNICIVEPSTAPAIVVTDNDCITPTPGAFTVTTACGAGSTIQWSTDNGTTWSTTAPTYDTDNAQTVIARCANDADPTCVSGESAPVTSSPTSCSGVSVCDCTEYLYINEGNNGGRVHKFELNESFDPNVDAASDAIANEVGNPWYDNVAAGETLTNPHGLAIDLNGYLYIGESGRADQGANIRRLTCDGDIIPATTFAIPDAGYNFTSIGNTLYVGSHDFDAATSNAINAYDLCTGDPLGFYCLNGIAESRDWGLFLDGNGFMYLTSDSFRDDQGGDVPNQLYKFDVNSTSLNAAGEANPVCIDPFISEGAGDPVAGNNTLPTAQLFGVTTDSNDNIFIVERTGPTEANGTPVIAAGTARVLKYDSNGNFITSTPWDDLEDGSGYFKAIGIYYSNTLDLLFVSTASPVDPCVALFDTDLNHLGDAIPSPGDGTQSKGINIKRECCPTNSIQDINQTFCSIDTSQLIFLNDLFPCSGGIICEGLWEQQSGQPAITYNACDQSIQIIENGCATFTKSSEGLSVNSQCGAFEITYNVCFDTTPDAPEITVTDNDCDTDTPGAFTVTTACATGSTIEWSTDNGTTWSTTTPIYDTANAQTVIARCADDTDATCVSAESTTVTSSPTLCPTCPEPNCFGISIQQN